MALNYQFNKTYQHQLNKALKVRLNALPTLQAKEAALRLEVKQAKDEARRLSDELALLRKKLQGMERLWPEFPFSLLSIAAVKTAERKIAGVKTHLLEEVVFTETPFSLFGKPAWTLFGLELLKSALILRVKHELAVQKQTILETARRKTTQKVNLYEKVQIPEYQEAIRRIKRFLEDEDNLAKSSQKILKERLLQTEAAA